jgi:hypothetical protein
MMATCLGKRSGTLGGGGDSNTGLVKRFSFLTHEPARASP